MHVDRSADIALGRIRPKKRNRNKSAASEHQIPNFIRQKGESEWRKLFPQDVSLALRAALGSSHYLVLCSLHMRPSRLIWALSNARTDFSLADSASQCVSFFGWFFSALPSSAEPNAFFEPVARLFRSPLPLSLSLSPHKRPCMCIPLFAFRSLFHNSSVSSFSLPRSPLSVSLGSSLTY